MQARIVSIGGDALSKKKCWKDREISPDGDRDCRIASRGLQGGRVQVISTIIICINNINFGLIVPCGKELSKLQLSIRVWQRCFFV